MGGGLKIDFAINIYSIWARKHLAGRMEILAIVSAGHWFSALFLHRGPEPDLMIGEYSMCPDVGCQCVFSVQQLLMFCLVSNWERESLFVCGS